MYEKRLVISFLVKNRCLFVLRLFVVVPLITTAILAIDLCEKIDPE